jgi:hypothetical protein
LSGGQDYGSPVCHARLLESRRLTIDAPLEERALCFDQERQPQWI